MVIMQNDYNDDYPTDACSSESHTHCCIDLWGTPLFPLFFCASRSLILFSVGYPI